MTMTTTELTNYLNTLLKTDEFNDYCPNGLQVDADRPISHIITGVTACQALIDQAIEENAQAILVHHGYFWKGEPAPLVGMKGKRIRTLMQNGISLIAYHLPLDAHPVLGNNAQLANAFGMKISEPLFPNEKHPVGNIINLETPIDTQIFIKTIEKALNRPVLHLSGGNKTLKRIGICTGGAQGMIEQAVERGCDAFISGEVSERTTHTAREMGIEYFACGHHATERGGIQALGEHIKEKLGLTVKFIDIDNPV